MTQINTIDNVEVRKEYYESGALLWEIPYKNGKEHGMAKVYYESGALRYETPRVNGEKHGIAKHYYESGALSLEVPYVNGVMHGIAKSYGKDNINIDCVTLYNKDQEVTTVKSII